MTKPKNYIERVLDVAKAYDHTHMPIDVEQLKEAYAAMRKRRKQYRMNEIEYKTETNKELTKLRDQLDGAEAGIRRLREDYEEKAQQMRDWQRHDIDLQRELARLREALKRIAEPTYGDPESAVLIARNALKETT